MKGFAFQVLRNIGTSARDLGKGISNDLRIGGLHALGAEPLRSTSSGLEMGFYGKNLTFKSGELLPRISQGTSPGLFANAFALFGAATTLATGVGGFTDGGLMGAAKAVTWDFGVNAALVRHAYQRTHDAGVTTYAPGLIGNSRLFKKMGKAGAIAGGLLSTGDVAMRYTWGSIVAGTLGNALGGGLLGTAGALVGGSLGVRHAGKLSLAAFGAAGAGAVGYGTYSVMKAGYNHTQMQKAIHTSGNMAAFNTQGAFTMRARAVSAMQNSGLNMRSALGQEANYMHNPSRNYHSSYRRF